MIDRSFLPKHGYCPECGEAIHNRGAHSEACAGRPVRDDWTGWYQCDRCHVWSRDGGRHFCGGLRYPVMRGRAGR